MGAFAGFEEKTIDRLGGRYTFARPEDVPIGYSPDEQNCRFKPGSVETRPGLTNRFTKPEAIYGISQFIDNQGNKKLIAIDSNGDLVVESGASLVNLRQNVCNPGAMMQAVLAFNRIFMSFYGSGNVPMGPIRHYDGTNVDHLAPDGPGDTADAVDSATAGEIAAGIHKGRVLFETRSGYITEWSVEFTWTAAGSKKVDLSAIPTGPDYVVARRVIFTAVGGEDYFYLTKFRIPNNTATTATLDFGETELLQGENYNRFSRNFRLPDQAGVAFYNQRIVGIGGLNTVKLINLDFDGGFGALGNPLGWQGAVAIVAPATGAVRAANVVTITTAKPHGFIAGDSVVVAGVTDASFNGTFTVATVPTSTTFTYAQVAGNATSGNGSAKLATFANGAKGTTDAFTGEYWRITGTGAAIVLGQIRNLEAATKFQPNTSYTVSARIRKGLNNPPYISSQNLIIDLFGTGVDTTGLVVPLDGSLSTEWTEFTAVLTSGLSSIPTDLTLRVFVDDTAGSALPNLEPIDVDRIQIWPTNQKFDASTLRISNPEDPDRFDGINGFSTLAKDDGQRIVGALQQRNILFTCKDRSMHAVEDDGISPPSLWPTSLIDSEAGGASANALDATSQFIISAARSGAYMFRGSSGLKLSQEIQPDWDRINWSKADKIHTLIDPEKKVVLFFVPLDADTKPRHALTLDYSEGWEEGQRKWNLDFFDADGNTGGIHGSIRFETSTKRQALYFAMEIVSATAGSVVENTGTDDYGHPINSYYDTAFVKDGEGGTDLFGGAAFVVKGAGTITASLRGMDDTVVATLRSIVFSSSFTIAASPTGAVRASNVVTITTTAPHGFVVGDTVVVAGVTNGTFNGTFVIASVPSTTSFTYSQVAALATSGSGTASFTIPTGIDIERQANIETERARLRFGTNAVGAYFQVKKVRVYCKQWAMERVM